MPEPRFIPLEGYPPVDDGEMVERSETFLREMRRRRTVRTFADRPVPRSVIERCILVAGTAPNGANLQPWHFVAVGPGDPELRSRIREAAEEEERRFYEERAPAEWLEALAPLGVDENKPFLEKAAWLIVIFAKSWEPGPDGAKRKNYYATESVGIATGMLITALHRAGLATLTHTPSPMGFLNGLLDRPENERPFLVLVVGHPAPGTTVPDLSKKSLDEVATFLGTGDAADPSPGS